MSALPLAIADREKPELTARLEELIAPPGFTGNAPGGPSRWSTARSAEWQPLRPELVVEVRYDHVTSDRFRHGTKLVRWRPDKAPAQCTFDQLPRADTSAGIAVNGDRTPGSSLEDRRARRDERRAKQREQNVFRAEAMHRARLAFEAEVRPSPTGNAPAHNVGCSGWFYWHWRGSFYPPDSAPNTWFGHYAARFSTVELNAPFYSWPTVATVESWLRQCDGRPFVYTVKVNELITHTRRFEGTERLVRDFGLIADLLGPHMGCLLFQLPPSFHYTAARLDSIVGQLDPRRRNVVEFRHRSWWHEDVYDAFREAGIIFCSCSGPRLPDELIKTADDVYLRFHGTTNWYRHDYTAEELAVWAARVRECRPARVWAYFNNDREAHAIKNADAFLQLLDDV